MEKLLDAPIKDGVREYDCALVTASLAQACLNACTFVLKHAGLTPKGRAFFEKCVENTQGIMDDACTLCDWTKMEPKPKDDEDEDDDWLDDYYDEEYDWLDNDDDDESDAPNITDDDLDKYAEYYGLNKEERKVLAKIVANKGSREGMTPHQIEVGKKIAEKVDAKEGSKPLGKR